MQKKLFTKNFTLLVMGQACSLFGNFILKFALSMYVLEETGSAAVFAGILAAATVPTILLSPLGGILSDRANRRNIMVVLDTVSGLCVLCAALVFPHADGVVVVGVLLVLLSVFGAFESPTVQACVPQMQTGDNVIRGNAVVNQVGAIAGLIAPLLGGVLYAAFGALPVMYASVACFFITAMFECFIRLKYTPKAVSGGIPAMIKNDFLVSMRFICKQERGILKILLLAALASFFVMGTTMVGLPFIVRTVLGLSVGHYGAAESALGVAAIVGSIAAGLLTGRLKMGKLSLVMAAVGVFLLPGGMVFLLSAGAVVRYTVIVLSFCGVQAAAMIFSIFSLSYIQQKTPNHLLGKVMAYVFAINMCVQPLGQVLYGLLFDRFASDVWLILIPSAVVICTIGLLSTGFFRNLEKIEGMNITGSSAENSTAP